MAARARAHYTPARPSLAGGRPAVEPLAETRGEAMTELAADPMAQALLGVLAGLLLSALIWPLRRLPTARQALVSVWLAAVAVLAAAALLRFAPGAAAPLDEAPAALRATLALRDILLVNAALQLLDLLIWDGLLKRLGRRRPVTRLLVNLVIIGVLVAASLLILDTYFAEAMRGILITSTVISAVIGLALQDVLSNAIAGVALHVERPFSLGDWVRVAGHEGEVVQLNWRTLTLRTRENHAVTITNGRVARDEIVNYARPERAQAVDLRVGVAYDHAPGDVRRVLRTAAAEAPEVLDLPAPRVFVESFSDFSIDYRVRVWVDDMARAPAVKDGVMMRIWYGLHRAGMGIPFPIRDVRLREVAPDAEARAAEARAAEVAEALRGIELLAPLDDDQLSALAARSVRARYTAGEALVRQGEAGDSLFVVLRGRARVDVEGEQGRTATVARRGPGEVFGEMSLLTGEPRSASVIALEEMAVAILGHDAFSALLLAEPAIAEALAAQLEARAAESQEGLAEAERAALAAAARSGTGLAARIRSFFGLSERGGASRPPGEGEQGRPD